MIRPSTGIRCLLLFLPLAATGCAYQMGSLTRPGFERVSLQMFANETFYRDLEVQLTQQVSRELSSRPGISIVPLERADIVLYGTIVEFRQRVLSEDDVDQIRESSAWTRVRIEIRDARKPDRILKTYEVADRAEFLLVRGENLASATDESFFDLARSVVDGLESELLRSSERRRETADDTTP